LDQIFHPRADSSEIWIVKIFHVKGSYCISRLGGYASAIATPERLPQMEGISSKF
jgi:hypothetical protein